MKWKNLFIICLLAMIFLPIGCCTPPCINVSEDRQTLPCISPCVNEDRQTYAIDQFMDCLLTELMNNFLDQRMITDDELKKDQRFLYSAFVDEGNYNETTPFGRLLGDALASRIQNQGFKVVEIRLSKAIHIHKKFGVVALSQDLKQLMDEHRASFVATGSYTMTPAGVYVSAKIIGKTSQVIYASASKWLSRSPLVDYLLNFREPTIKIEEME